MRLPQPSAGGTGRAEPGPPPGLIRRLIPESRPSLETDAGVWLGLLVAALLLARVDSVVMFALIVVVGALLLSMRWRIGPFAVVILLILGVSLRADAFGSGSSDVLAVTRAAIDQLLAGGNPYAQGYPQSSPPGATFPYGPLALAWYLPFRDDPRRVELAASLVILGLLAVRGRPLGLAIYAALPALVITASDGSNDTSAGLLLLLALLLAERAPRVGGAGIALAAAFKPYALAWLLPLVGFGGVGVLLPFAAVSLVVWGAAALAWGADHIVSSMRSADSVHDQPLFSLASGVDVHDPALRNAFNLGRYACGLLLAVSSLWLVRSARAFVLMGAAIFLATLYLGWWSTFAYLAAVAPILCWHLDDWLGLPRVRLPFDIYGRVTAAVDRRWPIRAPAPPPARLGAGGEPRATT